MIAEAGNLLLRTAEDRHHIQATAAALGAEDQAAAIRGPIRLPVVRRRRVVTCTGLPPSTAWIQISRLPLRSELNATMRPSGDQLGSPCSPEANVNCQIWCGGLDGSAGGLQLARIA